MSRLDTFSCATILNTMDEQNKIKNKLGFTLIELIVVLILLGILAASVMVLWPGKVINTAAQAMLLADDIRYTQSLAMTKGERYRLVQTSTISYQILHGTSAIEALPLHDNPVMLGDGTTFASATNTMVVFDSGGVPYVDTSTPGTALTSPLSFVLTSNGQNKTVSISPGTGRVIVQ